MKAMVLKQIQKIKEKELLKISEIPVPEILDDEVLLKVLTCGVCHTELDEIEGRTAPAFFPIILGHQVVGIVEKVGSKVKGIEIGQRVGVGWIYSACGKCEFCKNGNENLCIDFKATGCDVNGGYAEYMVAKADFVHRIPEFFSDVEAAPLLCAGAIGYRSLKLAGIKDGAKLGLIGFGASNHLVLKMVKYRYPNVEVFVFARNQNERKFAVGIGASWAGDIDEPSPEKLDSIIDTTPAWRPVVEGLKNLKAGGRLVINAIRKENVDKDYLLKLSYEEHLWLEREIKSVANVSRSDISEFLTLAAEMKLKPHVQVFSLDEANKALLELKEGKIKGAKVLKIS